MKIKKIDEQLWMKNNRKLKEQILNEMARIGFTDDGYEVYIRTDDSGNIPHFHYWDRETKGDQFNTCIRIDVPEYFHHTGKEDVLNHKQKKSLIKLLNEKRTNGLTRWQMLLADWNENNSNITIDENQSMPDYTML